MTLKYSSASVERLGLVKGALIWDPEVRSLAQVAKVSVWRKKIWLRFGASINEAQSRSLPEYVERMTADGMSITGRPQVISRMDLVRVRFRATLPWIEDVARDSDALIKAKIRVSLRDAMHEAREVLPEATFLLVSDDHMYATLVWVHPHWPMHVRSMGAVYQAMSSLMNRPVRR